MRDVATVALKTEGHWQGRPLRWPIVFVLSAQAPDVREGTGMSAVAIRLVATVVALAAVATSSLGLVLDQAYRIASPNASFPIPPQISDEVDLVDTVVLYDSKSERPSGINFRKLSEYYGLKWAQVDLSTTTTLDESLFKDEAGATLRAAHIDAAALRGMSAANLDVLKKAITINGLNLLVTGINAYSSELQYLTDGEVSGASISAGSHGEYYVASGSPEITRQLSGQTIAAKLSPYDYVLNIASSASQTDLIAQASDPYFNRYPIFARYRAGSGSIFLQSTTISYRLDVTKMWEVYFGWRNGGNNEHFDYFSQIVPMMMFTRFAAGEEAWHSNRHYANLTIDDPPLTQPFWAQAYTRNFYTDLLSQMSSHNFHTTIAFVPANYLKTQPAVAQLFRDNPDRFSLAVHGDNHTCPEFPSTLGQTELQRRANEALWRMSEHERQTGIPFAKVMIFPCEQSSLDAYTALKTTGYLATANGGGIPEGATKPNYWDYHMYQADLDFGNFASIPRSGLDQAAPLHELFVERPALVYVHANFFSKGMDAFNSWADKLNGVMGGVEWRSLDYIAKRQYLEKVDDDQSVSIKFYVRNVIVKNAYSTGKLFRFAKKETQDLAIAAVRANGVETPFRISSGVLRFDLFIPAETEVEIGIYYVAETLPPTSTAVPTVETKSTPNPGSTHTPSSQPFQTPVSMPSPTSSPSPVPSPPADAAFTVFLPSVFKE